jgi:hypothetical protein
LSNTFDFYYKGQVTYTNLDAILKTDSLKSRIIVADEKAIAELRGKGIGYTTVKSFQDFPHENLSLPFIIKKKRATTLDQFYLIKIR